MKEKLSELGCVAATLVIILALALAFGLAAFEAWLVMLLWNAVLVTIFPSIPTISFWVAWGVLILCNLLFKGIHTVTTRSNE